MVIKIKSLIDSIPKVPISALSKRKGGKFLVQKIAPKNPNVQLSEASQCLSSYNLVTIKGQKILKTDGRRLSAFHLPADFKTRSHEEFVKSEILPNQKADFGDFWCLFHGTSGAQIPWKMHIYSDNEEDWQKMYKVLSGYLIKNNINWKTVGSPFQTIEKFNQGVQKGKAFTLYPHSHSEFARLAHDINKIVSNNNLQIENTHISGDRALGTSGRIFYRYEFNSGDYKDTIIDTSTKKGFELYNSIYRGNVRGGGYLPPDMSPADDPWLHFDPNTQGAFIRE